MKLTKLKILVAGASVAMLLTSCQKEVDFQDLNNSGPGGSNSDIVLVGNWNFVGLSAKTNVGITVSQAGEELKGVALSDYATTSASGSLNVTATQFKFIQIGHTVDGSVTSETYLNGILFDSQTDPFHEVTDPSDETLDYVRNSNDSITFTNGIALLPDPGAGGGVSPVPTGPIGGKLSMSGDTLSVKIKTALSQTSNQGGIPAMIDVKLESVMRFKRQ